MTALPSVPPAPRRRGAGLAVRHHSPLVLLCLIAVLSLVTPLRGLSAQSAQGIAAVVNDHVVSLQDLDNRIDLLLATANLPDTAETRQRLQSQVLRSLVADALKQQESRRLKVGATSQEIDRAVAQVAQQINIEPEKLPEYLEQRGARMSTLLRQIETEIAWSKAVSRGASAQVAVRDDEIDEELRRARENPSTPIEYRVAEVFLPVQSRGDEAKVESSAQQLIEELRRGASFPTLARTFSQGPTAASGGDLGWVRRGQLPSALDQELDGLDIGEMVGPIRGEAGFSLLLLVDRRQPRPFGAGSVMLTIMQVFAPMGPQTPAQRVSATIAAMEKLRAGATSCTEIEQRNSELPERFSANASSVEADRLPPELRPVLGSLSPGETTQPLRVANGVLLLMLCDRKEEEASAEAREAIQRQIEQRKLTEASQRLLRDLWRTAVLDIRV